jgi:pSer/pThr/pTyr-binding forkhead associated (FHA) protein/cytochrome c556
MQRLLIRHIAGSRANQMDEFQTEGFREIIAGREEGAGICYPDREDLVSRAHARIYAEPAGSDSYYIADLESRNGTFLNRQRISAPSQLHHGDLVQLGSSGPEFRWELDPAPASAGRPTRVMGGTALLSGAGTRATRIASAPEAGPRPVGRATVERMLDETFGRVKHESGKTMWVGIAAILVLMLGGAGTWFYMRHTAAQNAARLKEQREMLVQMEGVVNQQPKDEAAVRAQMDKLSAQLKQLASQSQASQQGSGPAAAQQQGNAPAAQPQSNATAAVQEGASAAPPASYDAGLSQATHYYITGDYQDTYAECVQIIGMDQGRWEGYYYAGLAAEGMGRPSDALTAYQYALDDAPDNMKAQIAARVTALHGQPAQAN